jgi:DNA replication protein DnaC
MQSTASIISRIKERMEANLGLREAGFQTGACGHEVGIVERRQADGSWKAAAVPCKHCEDIKNAAEAVVALNELQKRKAAEKLALYSTMNEDQLAATFRNYEPENPTQDEALEKAEKLVNAIIAGKEKPVGILFAGSFGIGKSHLSAAACNAMAAAGRSAAFVSISQLKRKLTSTFNNGSKVTADEIMDYLRSVDLLVIDDIGQHAQSEFVDETLFDLLESRQGKANIFTTNLSGQDLIAAVGQRIFERIKNNSNPHKLEGTSRRKFKLDPAWDF